MIKYKLLVIKLVVITFFLGSCISAGSPVIRCYYRLYANEKKIEKTLNEFWMQNPENRVDSQDIQKIRRYYPKIFNDFMFRDTMNGDTSLYVFQWEIKTKEYYHKFWYLKSTDGKIIFNVDIANRNILTGNCSLNIVDVMFLDKIENNFRNWDLSSQDQKLIKRQFERDILSKMRTILKEK